MSTEISEARLIRMIDLGETGGHVGPAQGELIFADVNGDGRLEIITRQSAGQFRSRCYDGVKGAYVDVSPEERRVHCLAAYDLEGNHLWQVGTPHRGKAPYVAHGANDVAVGDVDGDGVAEIIVSNMNQLLVLDGATGALKNERPLPDDNFCIVRTCKFKGDARRQQIVVKVHDKAYPPYEYGNPTLVLDGDLSELWMAPHYSGAGHWPVFLDADGDGCDEMLVGYSLVDHDGRIVWTIPVENATAEHADHILPGDFDHDGRIEIAYAGSKDYFVADLEANILWKRPHEHAQKTLAGRFRADVKGETLILNEKWIGMTAYTPKGEALWSQRTGAGYADAAVRGWREDGLDLVLYKKQSLKKSSELPYWSSPEQSREWWPYLMDGEGKVAMRLPWKEGYAQPMQLVRGIRAYDCGIGYTCQAVDLDGDGRDEVVVSDRQRAWIFGPPR